MCASHLPSLLLCPGPVLPAPAGTAAEPGPDDAGVALRKLPGLSS